MDLRLYYQKIRAKESEITDEFPVVMSLETPDGGRPGALTEVTRGIASKMVVDGTAQLAPAEQAAEFRAKQAEAKRAADQMAQAAQMRLTVLPTAELERLKGARRAAKDEA